MDTLIYQDELLFQKTLFSSAPIQRHFKNTAQEKHQASYKTIESLQLTSHLSSFDAARIGSSVAAPA